MRIRYLAGAAIAIAVFAAPMQAQGGLSKVANDVGKTVKKAGRDTKVEMHRAGSKTHQALTKAGKDTKAELKRTTGVTSKTPDAEHKPGGVNKLARDVSHAGKKLGAKAKHGAKKTSSEAHGKLTKAGKESRFKR